MHAFLAAHWPNNSYRFWFYGFYTSLIRRKYFCRNAKWQDFQAYLDDSGRPNQVLKVEVSKATNKQASSCWPNS